MKILNVGLFGLFCAASSVMAAPCTVGSLQSYISLGSGGCGIGPVQFTNFVIAPGTAGATAINPANINVTPGGGPFNFTLVFVFNQTANAGQLFESFFHFNATGTALSAASIALGSSAITGDGANTGILDACPNAMFAGNSPTGCPTSPQSAVAFQTVGSSGLSDSLSFQPSVMSLDLYVDLTADGGSAGSARLTSATVSFSNVPEPSAAWLLAAGGSMFGLLRYRAGKSRRNT